MPCAERHLVHNLADIHDHPYKDPVGAGMGLADRLVDPERNHSEAGRIGDRMAILLVE